jgi:hypothetical protein
MFSRTRFAVLAAGVLALSIAHPALAQDGMKRTILNQADLSVVGDKPLKLYTVHVVDKGKPLFDGGEKAP